MFLLKLNKMRKKKQKKYTFTEEEKQLIRQLKEQFSMRGVPRAQWSLFIQQELMFQKKSKKVGQKTSSSGISKMFKGKIESLIQKIVKNKASKLFNHAGNSLEDILDLIEDPLKNTFSEDKGLANSLLSGYNVKIENNLGKHGTFISERKDKKRMIVNFDDDDEN